MNMAPFFAVWPGVQNNRSSEQHVDNTRSTMTTHPLMVTISGIRGIAGKSFTPAVVNSYVSSFAHLQRTKVDSSWVVSAHEL